MSVCGQNGHTEEDSGSEEVTAATAAVRDLYKQKPVSKVVRVLTVLAYLLSVSLAAILLSVYYVCVWKPPELPLRNDTELAAAAMRQTNHDFSSTGGVHKSIGGGDSAVNALDESHTTVNTTHSFENSSANTTEEFTSDLASNSSTLALDITTGFPRSEAVGSNDTSIT